MIGWHRASQMARALVSYIPSDERVLHEVRSVFPTNDIDLCTVKRIRRNRKISDAAFKRNAEQWTENRADPINSKEYAERQGKMATANDKFVKALHSI